MESLYVLQLVKNKYYVGKSADVIKRFEQHKTGAGSAWTKMYPPIKLLETRPIASPHDENNVTKDYMKKYGISNVRGGSYAQLTLPDDSRGVLEREFRGNDDQCIKCGLAGHFVSNCKLPDPPMPMKKTDWDRLFLEKIQPSPIESPAIKRVGTCYRCGRPGHWSSGCYARTHAKGYELD